MSDEPHRHNDARWWCVEVPNLESELNRELWEEDESGLIHFVAFIRHRVLRIQEVDCRI